MIIDSIVNLAGTILDKFVEDKDLKAKLNSEFQTQLIALDLAQSQTNMEQAKHASIFVAGARPAIMWICAFGLAWQFILAPIFGWLVAVLDPSLTLPALDTDGLVSLIMALLGLGTMRTVEKWQGVARNNLKD